MEIFIIITSVAIFLVTIIIWERHATNLISAGKRHAVSARMYMGINRYKQYICSCEANKNYKVYVGFVWAKYINTGLLALMSTGLLLTVTLTNEPSDPGVFVVLFLVVITLLILEYVTYKNRKLQLMRIGHSQQCSMACAKMSVWYQTLRVESFYIVRKRKKSTQKKLILNSKHAQY